MIDLKNNVLLKVLKRDKISMKEVLWIFANGKIISHTISSCYTTKYKSIVGTLKCPYFLLISNFHDSYRLGDYFLSCFSLTPFI